MRLIRRPGAVDLRRAASFLLSNRLLVASGLLTLVTGAWFGIAFGGSEPVVVLWFSSPVGAVILAVMFWQTSRWAWLLPVTRRFWPGISASLVCWSALPALCKPSTCCGSPMS